MGAAMGDGAGPPEELERFCATEFPRVHGALALYTGEPLLAEELAQEAFTRVCRDWKRVARMERPGAWVHRVAMNLARSRVRRRGARRRAEARMRAGAVEPSQPSTADAIAVRDAVAALPEDERAVIVLRYFADLSVAETADAIGIPLGTAKTRIRRALHRLGHDDLADEPDVLLEVNP